VDADRFEQLLREVPPRRTQAGARRLQAGGRPADGRLLAVVRRLNMILTTFIRRIFFRATPRRDPRFRMASSSAHRLRLSPISASPTRPGIPVSRLGRPLQRFQLGEAASKQGDYAYLITSSDR